MKKRILSRKLSSRPRYNRVRRAAMGFTLIELLVVVLIMAVVLGVIGACLAAGIRVWDEAGKFGVAESDAVVGLQIIEKDLKNSVPFHAIVFEGKRSDVSFASLVVPVRQGLRNEGGSVAQPRIGTVRYFFDAGGMALFRSQDIYGADFAQARTPERIMSNLRDVSLAYYGLVGGKGNGAWSDQWVDPTNRPVAVRISLSFRDREALLTKTVVLPMSDSVVP
jgi:prepilin-type N-terminal cleavage/methylation domain-containing protein